MTEYFLDLKVHRKYFSQWTLHKPMYQTHAIATNGMERLYIATLNTLPVFKFYKILIIKHLFFVFYPLFLVNF